MTRFRHDLILRMTKLLDAVLVTIPFAMCWYLYYAKRVASPYYAMGDYLVVALFFVLFIIFGRVYDAFLMSMHTARPGRTADGPTSNFWRLRSAILSCMS